MNNDAIQFVQRRSPELFAGGASPGRVIASNIAFAAAVLGAEHVDINEDTDWWIVASECDWMSPRPPLFTDCAELFIKRPAVAKVINRKVLLQVHDLPCGSRRVEMNPIRGRQSL